MNNRGSEWRQWDLHFHTPASYDYKDKSVSPQDIIDGLHNNGISLVAITDHYVIDALLIKELQTLGKAKGITVLPGIEFCSELGGSQSVHFIGIFHENADIESIWTKIQGQCSLTQLDIKQKGGYENVCCPFVNTCNLLLELGAIITIHAGSKSNTIESIKNNLLVKQELKNDLLSRFRPLLDVGKPADADMYRKYVFPDIKFSLPIILCSDNHNIRDYQLKERMWVKAMPTFEGLKQLLYEPEGRVRIQSTRPEQKDVSRIIDHIVLHSADNTFEDGKKIYLNPNLNSVIGGKSSGKSLLLYQIAKAIKNDEIPAMHAKLNLSKYDGVTGFDVVWADGAVDNESSLSNRNITYIPQLFINSLADSGNRNSLNDFILNLLQQNDGFKSFYDQTIKQISDISNDISIKLSNALEKRKEALRYSADMKSIGTEEQIRNTLQQLSKQHDELTKKSSMNEDEQKQFIALNERLKSLNEEKQRIQKTLGLIENLKQFVANNVYSLIGYTTPEGNVVGTLDQQLAYYEAIPADINSVCNAFKTRAHEEVQKFNNELDNLKYPEKVEPVEKQISEVKTLLVPLNKKLVDQKEMARIAAEIQNKNKSLSQLIELKKKLTVAIEQYKGFKLDLAERLRQRFNLYNSIVNRINSSYADIGADVHLSSSLVASRSALTFYDVVNKHREPGSSRFYQIFPDAASDSVVYSLIPDLVANIISVKDGMLRIKDADKEIQFYLNKDANIETVLNSLINDCFSISFDVRYKHDNLYQMSPGKKGTVLLILYLEISKSDDPILIDQPEDNLDNRTIYGQLCKMIAAKKSQRQIIIVTHNANLVVGTDSENIIVASQQGQKDSAASGHKFEYVNGPIELSFIDDRAKTEMYKYGIREHVCDILEGGIEAFEHREKKYGFKR